MLERANRKWSDVFALDARSLAAMRVGLGLVLLLNLCDLAWDLPAFYTDAGLLPRATRVGCRRCAWAWACGGCSIGAIWRGIFPRSTPPQDFFRERRAWS